MNWSFILLVAYFACCYGSTSNPDTALDTFEESLASSNEVSDEEAVFRKRRKPRRKHKARKHRHPKQHHIAKAIESDYSDETSYQKPRNATGLIPSIRLYPTELHLCSGVFVSHDTILTTARCIYGQPTSKLFVQALRWYMDRTHGVLSKVRKVYTHPDFEVVPRQADIAVLKLTRSIEKATVFYLPHNHISHRIKVAYMYGWKFSQNRQKFFQYEKRVRLITRAKCSLILKEYINCDSICAGGYKFQRGRADEGSPLAVRYRHRKSHKHFMVIIGLFDGEHVDQTILAEKYQLIYPYVNWIRHHISGGVKSHHKHHHKKHHHKKHHKHHHKRH